MWDDQCMQFWYFCNWDWLERCVDHIGHFYCKSFNHNILCVLDRLQCCSALEVGCSLVFIFSFARRMDWSHWWTAWKKIMGPIREKDIAESSWGQAISDIPVYLPHHPDHALIVHMHDGILCILCTEVFYGWLCHSSCFIVAIYKRSHCSRQM